MPEIVPLKTQGRPWSSVSVSQIKNFDSERGGCQTKWFRESVLRERGPSTEAQLTGTALHHHLETDRALAMGLPPPELDKEVTASHLEKARPIADAVIASGLLRAPDRILGLEATLSEPDPTDPKGFRLKDPWSPWHGIPWRGFVDVVHLAADGRIGVDDYKTTSRPKYAKIPSELREDVQMVSYAVWASERLGADLDAGVPVRHTYAMTRPRAKKAGGGFDVWPVDAVVSRDVVDKEWPRVGRLIQEMAETAKLPLEKVPKNPAACSAYGGCPHRAECWSKDKPQSMGSFFGTPTQTTNEAENNPMSTMMDAILARKKAAEAAAAGGTPAPAQKAAPTQTKPVADPEPTEMPTTAYRTAPKDPGAKTVADLQAEIARLQAQAAAAQGATGVKPPDAPAPIVHLSEETLGKTKSPSTVAAEDQVTAAVETGGRFRRTKAEMEADMDVEEAKRFRASGMTLEAWLARDSEITTAAKAIATREAMEAAGADRETAVAIAKNLHGLTPEEKAAGLTLAMAENFRTSGETDPKVWLEKALSYGAPGHDQPEDAPDAKAQGLVAVTTERDAIVRVRGPSSDIGPEVLATIMGTGLVLLLDCLPQKGADVLRAVPLDGYLDGMARKAAQFGQVPDYRLVDYGKGAGYLAGLIRDTPPAPGVYTLSSHGPTAKLALEVLLPMASLVIRGA